LPQKVRDVKRALTTKGFQEEEERDHRYYFYFHEGKKSGIFTKISHGESEIHDKNCSKMAKQIKLSGPQFGKFVDCELEKDEYLKHLIDGKHIEESNKQS